jgi:hypothetical protein
VGGRAKERPGDDAYVEAVVVVAVLELSLAGHVFDEAELQYSLA